MEYIRFYGKHKCDRYCDRVCPEIKDNIYHVCNNLCKKVCPSMGDSVPSSIKLMEWEKYELTGIGRIVIKADYVFVEFSFPLEKPTRLRFRTRGGFSRETLLGMIKRSYELIYQKERDTLCEKKERISKNGLNRNKTDGKYGIWGFSLNALYIEGLRYYENENLIKINIEA